MSGRVKGPQCHAGDGQLQRLGLGMKVQRDNYQILSVLEKDLALRSSGHISRIYTFLVVLHTSEASKNDNRMVMGLTVVSFEVMSSSGRWNKFAKKFIFNLKIFW